MNHLKKQLQTYFHHERFQPGQEEIIRDILAGNDVLGVLPTGSGKSLCYQLPAVILPGITLVISPLISLMIDQVRQIKAYHFKEVAALHSFQQLDERKYILSRLSSYKLLFLSPELLQQQELIATLQRMTISLFCIDEAHCISQWGYDFRPDYLRLHSVIKTFRRPPVLALTGTATAHIQQDILLRLQAPEMKKHVYSMEKKNITFAVEQLTCTEAEKEEKLAVYAARLKKPAIIYFSSRRKAEEITAYLTEHKHTGRVAFYHAGMQKEDRLKVQEQFIHDQLDIICCTSAFGMGINKANIRTVIHYHPPAQLESFLQEVGRAGRDGKPSLSLLLYRKSDLHIPLSMIDYELPDKQELEIVFRRLEDLQQADSVFPKRPEAQAALFQMPETKWRLLEYQLQVHGIMTENHYIHAVDRIKWPHALERIHQFFQERRAYKMEKMQEMIRWLDSSACLRTSLYANFEEKVIPKTNQCCSQCGFQIHDFETPANIVHTEEDKDWQLALKEILLFEDTKHAKTK